MEAFPYESKASADPAWDTIGVTHDGKSYCLGYAVYVNDFTCIGYMLCLELDIIDSKYSIKDNPKLTRFIGVNEFVYYVST
jgi:hypothetical protein